MITINLLPVQAILRRRKGRNRLLALALAVLAVAAGLAAWRFFFEEPRIRELRDELARQEARLSAVSQESRNIEARAEEARVWRRRLEAVADLEERRRNPARLLTEISRLISPESWLFSLDLQGAVLTLKGAALYSDVSLAEFLLQLEAGRYFKKVELVLPSENLAFGDMPALGFTILAETAFPPSALLPEVPDLSVLTIDEPEPAQSPQTGEGRGGQ